MPPRAPAPLAPLCLGDVYRKTTKRRGRTVKAGSYRARYRGADGTIHDRVINRPNGAKVTDKAVTESELRRIVTRVEREAAGLFDLGLELQLVQRKGK